MHTHHKSTIADRQSPIPPALALIVALSLSGCATGPRLDMAAADTLDAVHAALTTAIAEYHSDLNRADDAREQALLDALLARIQAAPGEGKAPAEPRATRAPSGMGKTSGAMAKTQGAMAKQSAAMSFRTPTQIQKHRAAFTAAMARVRADRAAAWDRYAAATVNLSILKETADGLRAMALDSLSLKDETRRLITAWLATAAVKTQGEPRVGSSPRHRRRH